MRKRGIKSDTGRSSPGSEIEAGRALTSPLRSIAPIEIDRRTSSRLVFHSANRCAPIRRRSRGNERGGAATDVFAPLLIGTPALFVLGLAGLAVCLAFVSACENI